MSPVCPISVKVTHCHTLLSTSWQSWVYGSSDVIPLITQPPGPPPALLHIWESPVLFAGLCKLSFLDSLLHPPLLPILHHTTSWAILLFCPIISFPWKILLLRHSLQVDHPSMMWWSLSKSQTSVLMPSSTSSTLVPSAILEPSMWSTQIPSHLSHLFLETISHSWVFLASESSNPPLGHKAPEGRVVSEHFYGLGQRKWLWHTAWLVHSVERNGLGTLMVWRWRQKWKQATEWKMYIGDMQRCLEKEECEPGGSAGWEGGRAKPWREDKWDVVWKWPSTKAEGWGERYMYAPSPPPPWTRGCLCILRHPSVL